MCMTQHTLCVRPEEKSVFRQQKLLASQETACGQMKRIVALSTSQLYNPTSTPQGSSTGVQTCTELIRWPSAARRPGKSQTEKQPHFSAPHPSPSGGSIHNRRERASPGAGSEAAGGRWERTNRRRQFSVLFFSQNCQQQETTYLQVAVSS